MSENPISDALHLIPYGFYSITTRDGDDRNVMVANWLTQVSFEPQHLALGIQTTSYSFGLMKKSGKLLVNIFAAEDEEVVKQFTKSREKDPEKFLKVHYSDAPVTGLPLLDEAAAYLECEIVELYDTDAGHHVVIARVVGGGVLKAIETVDVLTLPGIGWNYAG
jgi:flavin reductase (DIM6/NTAB) family NADH-FMN oxidoreductase RutF